MLMLSTGASKNQGAGVFHGVEEDRRHFAADTNTTAALVGYARHIIAEETTALS